MDQGLSIECLLVPLLQLLGPLHNDLLNLLILAAECGSERLLTGSKILLLGVQQSLLLLPSSLVLGSLLLHHLLGLINIGLLQDELSLALIQLTLGSPQFIPGLAEPDLRLSEALR